MGCLWRCRFCLVWVFIMKSSTIEAWGRGVNKIKEACDKYLELLNGKEDLHFGKNDQDIKFKWIRSFQVGKYERKMQSKFMRNKR